MGKLATTSPLCNSSSRWVVVHSNNNNNNNNNSHLVQAHSRLHHKHSLQDNSSSNFRNNPTHRILNHPNNPHRHRNSNNKTCRLSQTAVVNRHHRYDYYFLLFLNGIRKHSSRIRTARLPTVPVLVDATRCQYHCGRRYTYPSLWDTYSQDTYPVDIYPTLVYLPPLPRIPTPIPTPMEGTWDKIFLSPQRTWGQRYLLLWVVIKGSGNLVVKSLGLSS